MSFLRRLLGSKCESDTTTDASDDMAKAAAESHHAHDMSEQAYELDLLRGEQDRLDELRQRQLRYAQYAWTPPAEGGTRRAEDGDAPDE